MTDDPGPPDTLGEWSARVAQSRCPACARITLAARCPGCGQAIPGMRRAVGRGEMESRSTRLHHRDVYRGITGRELPPECDGFAIETTGDPPATPGPLPGMLFGLPVVTPGGWCDEPIRPRRRSGRGRRKGHGRH